MVFIGGSFGQIGAIALGAVAGLWLCRGDGPAPAGHLGFSVSRGHGAVALVLFAVLFLITPLVTARTGSQGLALFDAFYRSGSLVFGGGHVVLPLLQAEVVTPGWVSNADFLAGYGMAQAVPGPLFTFAAYLGADRTRCPMVWPARRLHSSPCPCRGCCWSTACCRIWDALRLRPTAQAAMRGTNAAVVGILGAALYNPVWTSAVLTPRDFAVALAGFLLLTVWKLPPWIVVVLLADDRRHSAADLKRHRVDEAAPHMLHCRIEHCDAKSDASMQLKAGDRAKLPLCRVWNGSNKITL